MELVETTASLAVVPPKPRGRPKQVNKPPCEFTDEHGVRCPTEAAFTKPGRVYCRPHYDKLRKSGKLAPLITGKDNPDVLAKALQTASRDLSLLAPAYAELHYLAAQNAAIKGNAEPCEWALTHTRAIAPIEKQDSGQKVQVNVGIVLPGLGIEQAQAITVTNTPVTTSNNK